MSHGSKVLPESSIKPTLRKRHCPLILNHYKLGSGHWEIIGIIPVCSSIYKNQTWECKDPGVLEINKI